ncbi:MAG TPA: response regulator transcription factor [Bdellovibrionales bacterium]|nr:response regulator transcription factor [Bdellovibrionales bacterium]
MKILLAEDDHHVSVIMQICLQKIGGHDVTLVEDGEAAVQKAAGGGFDLIILDGMMPKKSGLQAAKEIKSTGNKTPIIFLSAKSDEKEYLVIGTGFIPKPFEPTQICARIDEILRNAKGTN